MHTADDARQEETRGADLNALRLLGRHKSNDDNTWSREHRHYLQARSIDATARGPAHADWSIATFGDQRQGTREMTITETGFEKASFSELDFDPPCDWQLRLYLFGRVFVVCHCDKPPRWAANMPCCSHQTLSCPNHRYSTSIKQCSRCKQWAPTLNLRWRRI